ncbi:DUF4382 domain-containing protein [Paucihalobacter sp.]|uniref:DUF4382 domain-containing protein n=1 Tax=Paucihalobacter sp. TaxID=2850405 RepID=UPI002FE31405
MKLFLKINVLVLLIATLFFVGCTDSTDNPPSETSSISIKLVDNPGDYDNVFVEVVDVMIKYQDNNNQNQDPESGWQSLQLVNSGVYDLLELTGGVDLLLVDNYDIPSGIIQQIRLVLGDDNSIVIDGETFPLNTPSAQQSGLKIQINQAVEPNFNYTFILDFDAHESIVMAGNSDNIILKPVLRASLEAASGIISGIVLPADVAVLITATNGDFETSTFSDDAGNFMFAGLAEGVYNLTFTPDDESLLTAQTFNNVTVTVGETSDIGTIILE